MSENVILVSGARVHNLKNISFSIPIDRLTVVTGVSGSGKSSLAFDTVYAEGQRRYVESLSAYARQFLERMERPDVDEIKDIAPAIAIKQKNSTRNPRSTVGTQTEIYDYLRLLYARIGQTFCRNCNREIHKDSPQSSADEILTALAEGTRFYVLFPAEPIPSEPVVEKKARSLIGKKKKADRTPITAHLMSLMQRGFTRLIKDGQVVELSSPDDFKDESFDNVFVLVDRLVAREESRSRLVDSLETCFLEGYGVANVQTTDGKLFRFSEKFECKYDGTVYSEPEPRLFSFNNPYGACPTCQGFGNTIGIDIDLVIPNPQLTIEEGAVEPFTKDQYAWAKQELKRFCKSEGIPINVPFASLPRSSQKAIIEGKGKWEGINGFFEFLETKKYKLHVRVFLAKYRGYTRCPECDGGRLRQEARDVRVGGMTLPNVCRMPIGEAEAFFKNLTLSQEQSAIADRILIEIQRRLGFLLEVGLSYLTLERVASTLSGGEAQRIQLATNLGSSLVGALYVLDEPSIGLHPRDSEKLIRILENLRDIGNTVLVVEHDEEMIRSADYILDIGPLAGENGGRVVYEGPYNGLLKDENSLTARYLRGDSEIKSPKNRRTPEKGFIEIRGASENNLKNIDVDIPLGMMVCITGVSGSGKSTLVHDVLYAGLKKKRGEWRGHVGAFSSLSGGDLIDDCVLVDQSPIGRTPRSNPVTYIKVYDAIRDAFASTRESKSRGYNPSHFSFNVAGGRCDTCEGSGTVTVEMQFLADVELTCEDCKGTRFKSQVLDVRLRGKNIHDVLNMTVREAMSFFKDIARVTNKLRVLDDVGLGYLTLGQSATTLSGGEAQRVKLASYLSQKSGKLLYIFDEPTTGLHFDDINKLLGAFRTLIDAGGSLVVIEHNLDVIKTADYVIDLGPEGGEQGGELLVRGTPEEIMSCSLSYTGKFLQSHLRTAAYSA
jgi:excinuclease ABC subunit A